MTRDEIIAFARDSGVIDFRDADCDEHVADFVDFLCDFAASVAAAEREACAKVCEGLMSPSQISDPGRSWIAGTMDSAAAIRSRGNHA